MAQVLLLKPQSKHIVVPPLGLGYLASALKQQGFSSKIIHCSKERVSIPDVARLVVSEKINIVGVSCCSNDHPWVSTLAEELASQHQVKLVVGGPHATGLRGRLLELIPRIDFIVYSEGEKSFPKLVGHLLGENLDHSALSEIPNLIWKNSKGDVVENAVELVPDLDALEFPDWDQMPPAEYAEFTPHGGFTKASPVGQLMTTRGCPYGCNYCAARLIHGRKIRCRSPESIVEEIEYLINVQRVREIHIEDDNFTENKDHVFDLCTKIRKRNIRMPFALPNGVRLDRLDDEILQELQATGFYMFFLGIESGSQATLKRMNKALDLGKVKETISRIRKYDFQIKGYFIIGYPGETKEDIRQTIDYARSLDLDRAYFTMFIPLPGSVIFNDLEKAGKIDIHKFQWTNFYTKGKTTPPFIPEGMTSDELEAYSHLAYRSFYLRPHILLKMLRDMRITSFNQFLVVAWNLARLNLSYFL